jgi:hypothetical protein
MMSEEPCPNCAKIGTLSRPYIYQTQIAIGVADNRFPGARLQEKRMLVTKSERACLDCGLIESKVTRIDRTPERMLTGTL